MPGFGEAFDILSGSSPAPVNPDVQVGGGGQPTRITVRPQGSPSQDGQGGFGRAFSILSGEEPAPPAAPPAAPQRQAMGAMKGFETGIRSGITANFSDELSGLNAAGRSMLPDGSRDISVGPIGEALLAASGAGRMLYESMTQPGSGTAAYEKARDEERYRQAQAAEEHPIANIGGNVVGALALPVGGTLNAASLPVRMARGAAVGAGYGAAYGAGEGQGAADRATRAATGAALGGVAGAAAPAVLSGVGAASRAIGSGIGGVLGHPVQTVRGFSNPDQEAARRIGTNVIADMQTGRPGMSAADLNAARQAGQPTAIIDVGGENTRALARSAANTSPSARAALEDMTGGRFAGQSQRVSDFVKSLVGTGGNATRSAEAIDAAERANVRPAYIRAYQAGDRPISSPEIERLAQSPDVIAAMRDAIQKGKSRAIADGFDKYDPNTRNLQFWDYTYRNLRDKGSEAFRAGRSEEGSYLSSIAKQLRSELDIAVPEFAKTRQLAAEYFGAENALEAGQKFVGMRVPIEEARTAVSKMNPTQKAMFAEGFVSDLADKVLKVPDNRSVTIDRIFNSPDGKARIELALGKGKAADLEYFLRRENMMDLARKAVSGNSTTARQIMEAGIAGGVGAAAGGAAEAALSGDLSPKTIISAAVLGGAAAGHRAINFKVAQRVGEMLASDDPKVLATALKMAKTNPDAGRAIRRGEVILEKLIGQRSNEAAPLIPQIAPGRAEDQQQ